jgi:hypothetical protein
MLRYICTWPVLFKSFYAMHELSRLQYWTFWYNFFSDLEFGSINAINESCHYIIRKYVLTIRSENNYIFSHRIIYWVCKYMFRPCILAIARLYYKLKKQLYNTCVGYCGGNEMSFKWTRPFRRKTKSGFCACALTFQLASNNLSSDGGLYCCDSM